MTAPKSGPTPGPWVALEQRGGGFYIRPAGQVYLLAHIGDWIETHDGSHDANARLIAAAPDLLEAAKEAIEAIAGGDAQSAVNALRAALAKAVQP